MLSSEIFFLAICVLRLNIARFTIINYLTLIIASSFGEQINSTTFISLTDDSILITNTTLYCVAEDKTSPQVVWSYLNPSGTRSNLTATTNNVTTGISTLYVYSNNPGYYSCEVTTEEGTVVTHTVRMLDTTLYTGVFTYTP